MIPGGDSTCYPKGAEVAINNCSCFLYNSIIWNTIDTPDSKNIHAWDYCTLLIAFSDIDSNEIECEAHATFFFGPGNIDTDPMFVDTIAVDFHLY